MLLLLLPINVPGIYRSPILSEFYEVERFTSRGDFLAKAGADNLWFNVARRNSGKEDETPWGIIHQRNPKLGPATCMLEEVTYRERSDLRTMFMAGSGFSL